MINILLAKIQRYIYIYPIYLYLLSTMSAVSLIANFIFLRLVQNYTHATCKARTKHPWNSLLITIPFSRHWYCYILGDMIISTGS